MGAVADVQLGQDAGDVPGDRAFANEQGARDLAVAVSSGEQVQPLLLTAGEVKPAVSRRWPARGRPACTLPADKKLNLK